MLFLRIKETRNESCDDIDKFQRPGLGENPSASQSGRVYYRGNGWQVPVDKPKISPGRFTAD